MQAGQQATRAMTNVVTTIHAAQNAIDRIVWALYARPRAVPAYIDVIAVTDALNASGTLATRRRAGYYVLERHVPEVSMRFDDGLLSSDDVGEARLARLAAGEAPSTQERLLWRWRWTQHALSTPEAFELPAYSIGPIRARTGERAYWLALIDGGPDAYLGVDLFGFACTIEEIFTRFRATVVAATPPPALDAGAES